jgi:hypothetical protein
MTSSALPTFPILNGENVKLRELYRKDAKRIPKLLTQEISYYLKPIIPNPYKIEDAIRFITERHRTSQKYQIQKGIHFWYRF